MTASETTEITLTFRFRVLDETLLRQHYDELYEHASDWVDSACTTPEEIAGEIIVNLDLMAEALGRTVIWDELGLERLQP